MPGKWKKLIKIIVMLALAISPNIMAKKAKSSWSGSKNTKTSSKKISFGKRGGYSDFLDALGMRESNGDYSKVNQFGYLGKYQMGEMALIDAGFYVDDGTNHKNNWDSKWSDKAIDNNVYNSEDFLNNPKAQEEAVRGYTKRNWQYIRNMHLDLYNGRTINGTKLSVSGMLAGAHLVGVGGLRDFIMKGEDVTDGNGVSIAHYIDKFADYETPYDIPIVLADNR